MQASIAVTDFDAHLDDFAHLRVSVFNHQPSGVQANLRDLSLFSRHLHRSGSEWINGEVLLDFLAVTRSERSNGAGALNRKIASLRSYMKHLRFRQVDGADAFPIECLPRAREPYSGPVEALQPQEVRRLFRTIDVASVLGFRDFLLYSLLYRLGLRIGEALAIDLNDVDLQGEKLQIHGKGRRERSLPIPADLTELISNWLRHLRPKLTGAERMQALFISKKGNRLAVRTAEENFQKIVNRAGPFSIAKVTPHSLRHAFASHAVDERQDMVVLKHILGHALMQSTERYAHPSMKILTRAVNDHVAAEILADIISDGLLGQRIQQARR
jgi:site-specific recombinase XerD